MYASYPFLIVDILGEYVFAMVPGNYEPLMAKLNTCTKGEYDMAIDGATLPDAEPSAKAGRGGRGGRGKGRK